MRFFRVLRSLWSPRPRHLACSPGRGRRGGSCCPPSSVCRAACRLGWRPRGTIRALSTILDPDLPMKPAQEEGVTPRRGRKAGTGVNARTCRCGDPEARLGAQGRRQGPSEGGSRRLPLASLSAQLRNCPRAHKAGPNPDLMQDAARGAPTGPPRGACAPRKAVPCLPELERVPGGSCFPAFRNVLALPGKYTFYIYLYVKT
ncbi:uncharacterized protein LOC132352581 [Balaenoptera ricei]|uniref:uncharacterized protein LOC132352581 n=1 Tax=Balaenoptera ricei TaxID=2746895 RepID=UPI0028BDA20E|nr:uncharacterized protein LOC132352581 [Balaenoptera ricei]